MVLIDKKFEGITIRLNDQMKHRLTGLANLEGVSLSEYLREIIEAHLKIKTDEFRLLQEIFEGKNEDV